MAKDSIVTVLESLGISIKLMPDMIEIKKETEGMIHITTLIRNISLYYNEAYFTEGENMLIRELIKLHFNTNER